MAKKFVRWTSGCKKMKRYQCFEEPGAEKSSPVYSGQRDAYGFLRITPEEVREYWVGPEVQKALAAIKA